MTRNSAMPRRIEPIPCKPWALNGLSERLMVSHYENNYGAAVRSLNATRDRLATIDLTTASGADIRGLKREELDAMGSVALHELYFGSLGAGSSGFSGDGEIPEPVLVALEQQFGSVAAWRLEFSAVAKSLSGGSGWVLLSYARRDGNLYNQIAFDHSQAVMDTVPVLALDMYEHAYHLEFGANATAYIDAFMRNIDWRAVGHRLLGATGDPAFPRQNPPTDEALPSISVEELAAQIARGQRVQVLDARPRHYFSRVTDMMAGATWRDPERVDDWCGELATDTPVAVYCAYGFHVGCGVTAALRERGFDARYIRGGLAAWYGMGGPRALRSAGGA
jgi:Fe-Mn family superoxide dismutase